MKQLAKEAKTVWLASDEDREGEAIAWHLFEVLGLKKENTKRIVFHEITKDAILHAINNPRDIDKNLVDAQQARRVLDRLVGFEVSPVLWKKVKPSLSAGRVQSVAVKLIVEREREINHFVEQKYYKVTGTFETKDANGNSVPLKAELSERFSTQEETVNFLEHCKKAAFSVVMSRRNRVAVNRLHRSRHPRYNRRHPANWDFLFRRQWPWPRNYTNRDTSLT